MHAHIYTLIACLHTQGLLATRHLAALTPFFRLLYYTSRWWRDEWVGSSIPEGHTAKYTRPDHWLWREVVTDAMWCNVPSREELFSGTPVAALLASPLAMPLHVAGDKAGLDNLQWYQRFASCSEDSSKFFFPLSRWDWYQVTSMFSYTLQDEKETYTLQVCTHIHYKYVRLMHYKYVRMRWESDLYSNTLKVCTLSVSLSGEVWLFGPIHHVCLL